MAPTLGVKKQKEDSSKESQASVRKAIPAITQTNMMVPQPIISPVVKAFMGNLPQYYIAMQPGMYPNFQCGGRGPLQQNW